MTERSERPMSLWISSVRPPCLPCAASRAERVCVARGSIPYSAVTQPLPVPLRNAGTRSSTEAAQRTFVSPKATSAEPSACRATPVSIETARISDGLRPSGRGVVRVIGDPRAVGRGGTVGVSVGTGAVGLGVAVGVSGGGAGVSAPGGSTTLRM